ncbi:MarR family winged helix-turn-helix transcriptional regulator [Sphingobacterium sp. SGG-5]|uniref:MarR family winged helix-turn-helix transcriptional regulator n=1 Tax=Sphingobacterium sp. SGG-5 TaxID=2710881 RepID=UPI0019D04241|nr:MarR family winged helix-turn-helix transcriptional regulator [Sphingobacterium sp. SGG-5]
MDEDDAGNLDSFVTFYNQKTSILSLIASGCHRLSEIASRLEKPATNLAAPLDKLIQLGYIKREIPFGENPRTSKKSLYLFFRFFAWVR